MNRELSLPVKDALERLKYWERRRDSRTSEPVVVGDCVYYKDEQVEGIVRELIDGKEGRKTLVGREGALVAFASRTAVPVFLWALRSDRPENEA